MASFDAITNAAVIAAGKAVAHSTEYVYESKAITVEHDGWLKMRILSAGGGGARDTSSGYVEADIRPCNGGNGGNVAITNWLKVNKGDSVLLTIPAGGAGATSATLASPGGSASVALNGQQLIIVPGGNAGQRFETGSYGYRVNDENGDYTVTPAGSGLGLSVTWFKKGSRPSVYFNPNGYNSRVTGGGAAPIIKVDYEMPQYRTTSGTLSGASIYGTGAIGLFGGAGLFAPEMSSLLIVPHGATTPSTPENPDGGFGVGGHEPAPNTYAGAGKPGGAGGFGAGGGVGSSWYVTSAYSRYQCGPGGPGGFGGGGGAGRIVYHTTNNTSTPSNGGAGGQGFITLEWRHIMK